MKALLASLAIAPLCLCLPACGDADKGAGSAANLPSNVGTATVSAPTDSNHTYGDYDEDDHYSGQGNDGDNDDSDVPKDRDNDSDNASGSYYDKDDGSIRDYGRPADLIDRRRLKGLVKRYFAAAAIEDGASACKMIISPLARSLPEDLGRPPGPAYARGKTCSVVLSKVFKENHRQLSAYSTRLQVAGVRVNRDHGFAVLAFRSLPGRQIAVTRESSVWKIEALLDNELP